MNISKKMRTLATVNISVMLICVFPNVYAEEKIDIGKLEYDSACAVCHGLNGKGDDAAMKLELVKPVPNLTELAEKNDGVFPVDLVYQVIDGRREIRAHGLREMPIWGRVFKDQTSIYFEQNPPYNKDWVVHSRVLALIDYLSRLQEK